MVSFTFKQLRYFVTAADAEGITAASRILNITQPSLSAAIAQLEAVLDIQLFVRHKARGLEPAIRQRTRNVETLRGLVANGDCFSLLNLPSFSQLDYGGRRLVSRPLDHKVTPLKIVLAWPRGARPTARASAFTDHCRGYFTRLEGVV